MIEVTMLRGAFRSFASTLAVVCGSRASILSIRHEQVSIRDFSGTAPAQSQCYIALKTAGQSCCGAQLSRVVPYQTPIAA